MNSGDWNALFDIRKFVWNSSRTNKTSVSNGLVLTLKCTSSSPLSSILVPTSLTCRIHRFMILTWPGFFITNIQIKTRKKKGVL